MSPYRTLAARQRTEVYLGGPALGEPQLLFETEELLVEAPNWSSDGQYLYVNGHGRLWSLDVAAPQEGLTLIEYTGLPDVNNDHVLDPDGEHVFLSAADGHIYRGAVDGGAVERVTPDDGARHFLHGVSPDGRRLAYVHVQSPGSPGRLAVLEIGQAVTVAAGTGHLDGPEWSPDGRWIYVNTEAFSGKPGHTQIARLPDGGGPLERVMTSSTVDWFPHLSPNGRHACYLTFPAGTLGHPANLEVTVVVVDVSNWAAPLQRYPLFGGQGTLNVNSWSPDGQRFGFVAYPVAADA